MQHTSDLGYFPQRIISLVPSQTELLSYLQLDAETIGITRFCIHPPNWFKTKQRIGGTKDLHLKKIQQLNPDLVIANKEENVKEQVEELARYCPVWLTDVNNLADALQMITDIGTLTNRVAAANTLIDKISTAFASISKPKEPVKAAYLIWRNPYMAAGGYNFIHDMLQQCGFQNVFAGYARYPQISMEALQNAGCNLLLLSTEPYPFKKEHIDELAGHLPGIRILLADGEMFSWYGSRLLQSPAYFTQLITEINSA